MKVGTLVKIVADLVPVLEKEGVLTATDDFVLPTAAQWEALVPEVNQVLLAHGITEPDQVKQVIDLLPTILPAVFAILKVK